MALVQCPHCQHSRDMKNVRTGRFTVKCPQCAQTFLLAVRADPDKPPVIVTSRAELDAGAPSLVPAAKATVPGVAGAIPGAAEPTPPAPKVRPGLAETQAATSVRAAGDGDATGAWSSGQPETVAETIGTRAARSAATDAGDATGDFSVDVPPSGDAPEGLDDPEAIPATLGGYAILDELGRGGMGAVYLAKQQSLGRNVALKVMRPEWASNPTFLARFTREAYAAAQLVHHNIVQIYDFGEDKGTSFFSMEFVEGQTLAHLVKAEKRLDAEAAVGYVLQAARGLKAAHDQSMIHRDIKPDNLLLNKHGVVKVADLGLVKTPEFAEELERREESGGAPGGRADDVSIHLTRANIAMGTPAFMAPEQCRDAAGVDARADIYSLGCTLYDLVTGRPPFEGKTAIELMTKHQTEPVIPPETVVKRVPKALSEIILKMVAKRPEDRYQDLGEVIAALEEYLGVRSSGPFTPREEHAELLERCVSQFQEPALARLRPKLLAGFLAGCALLTLLLALSGRPLWAGAFLGLGVLTTASYFVIDGVSRDSYLFSKARALVLGSRPADWLTWIFGGILLLTLLVLLGLIWVWLGVCLLAVGLAFGIHFLIDRRIDAERAEPLEETEQMLKKMRLLGLEEDALRQFVCKYSGDRWEEFYEALFGYEAKMEARKRWGRGERGKDRPTFGAWRDPILARIESKQKARQEAKERALLQKVEEKSLQAKGDDLISARRKARKAAEAMVAAAAEIKEAGPSRGRGGRSIAKAMQEAARKPDAVLARRGPAASSSGGVLDLVVGPRPRFLVGAALLAGCLAWMNQNHLISGKDLQQAAAQAKDASTSSAAEKIEGLKGGALEWAKGLPAKVGRARPLELKLLPRPLARLFNGFGPGVAGLILVLSSFFAGPRMAVFAVPGAALALFGSRIGIPSLGPLNAATASMAIGGVVGVVGLLVGRK